MLVIREEQLAAFRASRDRTFIRALVPYLRMRVPGRIPADDAAAAERAGEALERARRHALRGTDAIGAFIALAFDLGAHFDEHPHVQRALRGGEPAEVVFLTLATRLTPAEWQEVRGAVE